MTPKRNKLQQTAYDVGVELGSYAAKHYGSLGVFRQTSEYGVTRQRFEDLDKAGEAFSDGVESGWAGAK